jgi:hypothetical protein
MRVSRPAPRFTIEPRIGSPHSPEILVLAQEPKGRLFDREVQLPLLRPTSTVVISYANGT